MSMKRKIVIITDCTDVAFLEIRGAIYSNIVDTNENYEIEPIVKVDNYNITNTSFLVRLIAEIYPYGTLINVVVHPSKRRGERIVGRTEKKGIIFEGTNTGAFGWLLKDFGCSELYEIDDKGFVPFGGKYVHAPVVGKIISGSPLYEFGKAFGKKRYQAIYCDRMMDMDDGELVIYPGSSLGFPEIGIVRGNAAEILDIKWTDKIILEMR